MASESQNKKIDWLGGIDWEQFFGVNGSLGGADLLFAGSEHLAERIGELLFVLLICLRDASGKPAYLDIFVILPPDADESRYDVMQHIADTMLGIRGIELDQKELEIVLKRIHITRMGDLHISTVVTHIKSIPARSFVLIVESSRYRTPNLLNENASFASMRLDEDLWIPYLQNLTIACAEVAQRNDLCVLIDAGQFSPLRESNYNMLHSIEPCSISIAVNENYDLNRKLVLLLSDWDKQIQAGQIDKVLEQIDELPAYFDTQKPILKIQVLHKSGENLKAVKLIESYMILNNDFDAQLCLRLASIANAGEAPELAKKLLDGAIANLSSQEHLDLALTLCRNLSLSNLETECIVRLECLYPCSGALHDHRVIRLFQASQSTAQCEPINIFGWNTDFGAFANRLLVELQIETDPDYHRILDELGRHWLKFLPEARLCCAVNAKERQLSTQVLVLAKPSQFSGDFARITAQFLLWAIENCLLDRNAIAKAEEILVGGIIEIIQYTALNPEDQRTRSGLSRLMSVQVAASEGISLLAIAVLELFQTAPEFLDSVVEDNIEVTDEDFIRFFESAIEWLGSIGPVYIGRVQIPIEFVIPSANGLLNRIYRMVDQASNNGDLEFLKQLVTVGCAITPYSQNPNKDLELIRLAAGKFVVSGAMQQGRDYAEHCFTITKDDPQRARLAWFAYADIYHRCQNHIEALIGMANVFASSGAVTSEQAFHEIYCLIRLFRDLGLTQRAKSILPTCYERLDQLGFRDKYSHRVETLEIGINLRDMSISDRTNPVVIVQLAEQIKENLRTVFERKDEALPASILAAQIVQLCDNINVHVCDELRDLLRRADRMIGTHSASLMRLVSYNTPTAADLLEWVHKTEAARYSDDVGYDVHILVRTAKRLLSSQEAKTDRYVATFAAELTTDHGLAMPGVLLKEENRSQWLPSSINEPGQRLEELSQQGVCILMLVLNEDKQLVCITAQNGLLSHAVYEDKEVFSTERLREWSKEFPFKYGLDNKDANLFYNTMRGLGLTQLNCTHAIFVLDTQLQNIPPQLLLVQDELFGRSTPIAVAPSITWLYATLTVQQSVRGPSFAWVSTEVNGDSDGTLAMVAERLCETLRQHGIELNTEAKLPKQLESAELAIVAAHGGVASEGRYFQVVADENKLKMSSVSLSQGLRNVGVAVLFICSGGRYDKHPNASTAIGLPKELLDRGCIAVIASPWPLDSRVPSHWLPAFLDAWEAGDRLIDANYKANTAVKKAMGDSPELCMAMTVYGNPLLVRQNNEF